MRPRTPPPGTIKQSVLCNLEFQPTNRREYLAVSFERKDKCHSTNHRRIALVAEISGTVMCTAPPLSKRPRFTTMIFPIHSRENKRLIVSLQGLADPRFLLVYPRSHMMSYPFKRWYVVPGKSSIEKRDQDLQPNHLYRGLPHKLGSHSLGPTRHLAEGEGAEADYPKLRKSTPAGRQE